MTIYEEDFHIELDRKLLPGPIEQVLFFDIETTGFSASSAYIYLIGCIFYKQDRWQMRQWFLDDIHTEKDLLCSFFEFMKSYHYLIHFNGSSFDLPFIEKRMKHYQALSIMEQSFTENQESLDLYKEIKPFKNLLQLTGLKQKNLEEFIGIDRKDPFTGGQLIEVYFEYLEFPDHRLLSCLLLHNADDLRGMLSIFSIRSYALLFSGSLEPEKALYQADKTCVYLDFSYSNRLPKTLHLQRGEFLLELGTQRGRLSVQIRTDELKYFYPDYKDYYYLPAEDRAIHKSIAAFVDKEYRVKAKASNCYTRKEGLFLPCQEDVLTPVFKESYKNSTSYMELTPFFLEDKQAQKAYLQFIFRLFMKEEKADAKVF